MAGAEKDPQSQLGCKIHDLAGARFQELPIETVKRIKIGAGISRQCAFAVMHDVGVRALRFAHLPKHVVRVQLKVVAHGKLTGGHA